MTSQIRALLVLAAFTVPLAACPGGTQGFAFVSDVNGAYRPEGSQGSTFIVEGIQFGTTQGSSNVYFTNSLGLTVLPATVTSWTNNFVVGTVPTGAISGPISVNNGNGPNLGLTFFNVSPQNPPAFTPAGLAWTAAAALPVGLSGQAIAAAINRSGANPLTVVYVVGGAGSSGTPGTAVYYMTPGGSWTATASLPTALAFSAAVVVSSGNSADTTRSGHLLVIGGATSATGASSAAIYRGTLNADGSVASWSSVTPGLPAALHSLGATIFMGHLYVVGGAGSNNAPAATVYRAVVEPDGTLGAWNSLTPLPSPRSHFGFGQFNGYLYVVGGDAGTITPNDSVASATAVSEIDYAPVDLYSRNLLAGWTKNTVNLPAPRMAETAVLGGVPGVAGKILVSGGIVTGTPADEELYASINSDGSVGSFTAASSQICAGCIFNHAATGYTIDNGINGQFHVLVVGGDNQTAPGTKRTGSSIY